MRLSEALVAQRTPATSAYGYDRKRQAVGIIHFGIGAFHRAHQAWYCDAAMNGGEQGWMISGVSLRTSDVAAHMNPQDGLYTLVERSGAGVTPRIIGAVRDVLTARRDGEAVIARLAAPATHIASLTITEKGYCRAADATLDTALAGADSVYRYLAHGLARRRDAGLPGLTLMSCDNLADNGRQLEKLMTAYCAVHDPDLGSWIADNCTFPCTMVDRIVPATTDDDRALTARLIGLDDAAAVMTEPFSQWVIEDRFAGPRPGWHKVGATLVSDVAPYETAKLRMLNGAHSALAYIGLARGHAYVHEAIADPPVRVLIERLMRGEAQTSLDAAPDQDLRAYADSLLTRFANPALPHRLIQIAMDGSQKIPQRWLATLAHHQAAGASCPTILTALAAWMCHIRGDNEARWGPVDDPMATALRAVWDGNDARGAARALFGRLGIMSGTWHPNDGDIDAIANAIDRAEVHHG